MRILTLLVLLMLTVASCAKKEAPKFNEAQSEPTSFGAEAPGGAPAKEERVEAAATEPVEASKTAPSPQDEATSADAAAVPEETRAHKGSKPKRKMATTVCDVLCKTACAKFETVRDQCEKAYLAGCFYKPRTVDVSKCRVEPPEADKDQRAVAAPTAGIPGKVEKSEGDGAALPELFGDP